MRKSLEISLILLSMIGSVGLESRADQTDYPIAQNTGILFILPVGARGTAMGQGLVAETTGLESFSWNPAGLASGSNQEISVDYSSLFGDMSGETIAYAYRWPWLSVALLSTYFSYGKIEQYDLDAYDYPIRLDNPITPYSLLSRIGMASQLSPQLVLGFTVKWLREDFVQEVINYYAGDLGIQIITGIEGLKYGAVIQNIGPKLGGFSLPLSASVGLAYHVKPAWLRNDVLLMALDGVLPQAQALQAAIGLEYKFLDLIALRIGYRSGDSRMADSIMTGFSAGLGVQVASYSVQYAFTPNTLIGHGHRITLVYQLGNRNGSENSKKKSVQKNESQYLFEYLK